MGNYEKHTGIDLHDVQGNIIRGYGAFGFPFARYVLFRVRTEDAGRAFVEGLIPLVTTSAPWTQYGDVGSGTAKPDVTTNVAFTHDGLRYLGVPEKSLLSFPDDFAMGMRARVDILGDDRGSAPERWDPVWLSDTHPQPVHILVTINAKSPDLREARYDEITAVLNQVNAEHADGVEQLAGHRSGGGEEAKYQEASAVFKDGIPTHQEHFGYTDGISNPYFRESGGHPDYQTGGGKRVYGESATTPDGWDALATGEFLLGHADEAREYPAAPIPSVLAKNGSFLVYRKLHQNVKSFDDYLASEGAKFGDEELFSAKLVGRWKNGAPLATFPTKQEADDFVAALDAARAAYYADRSDKQKKTTYYDLKRQQRAFDYRDDIPGASCPVGAHARRVNPRGALEFGEDGAFGKRPGALVDRRRIARRGLPYGESDIRDDDGDHGIVFMAIGASISRQFEFVQQQWVNYGNDFKLANDRDPVIGNHGADGGRMVIEADPDGTDPPFFCTGIPRFVETRGGDYFFVPSLTAL
ncbi:MAG: Dyp-type peroxidase, partial [Ilumatobacteraceae bacterium]